MYIYIAELNGDLRKPVLLLTHGAYVMCRLSPCLGHRMVPLVPCSAEQRSRPAYAKMCTSFFTAQKNNYVTLASGSHTPQSSPPAICHPTPPPSSPPPISVDPLLIRGHPPPPANPTTAAPGPSLPRLLHRRLTRRSHHCRRRCLHLRPNRSLRSRRSSTCYCTVRDPSG